MRAILSKTVVHMCDILQKRTKKHRFPVRKRCSVRTNFILL